MKTLLILAWSDLSKDPRVYRQIQLLSKTYRIIASGLADPKVDGVRFIRLVPQQRQFAHKMIYSGLLLLGAYEIYYWKRPWIHDCLEYLSDVQADLILANDIDMLPVALKIARNRSKVIVDLHEYAPSEFEDNFLWRFLFQSYKSYLCRRYLPITDGAMTVCDSIRQEYSRKFGMDSVVVMNMAKFFDLHPSETHESTIKMVHHGGAVRSRRIENMIDIMTYLDERFSLDLILVPSDQRYLNELKNKAKKMPRVRFLSPLPMTSLAEQLNSYDIGLYLLPPNSFNNRYALPNKFFEFIQARLAIAIGPSPEMGKFVNEYNLGVLAEDFSPISLANKLNQLTRDQIAHYKTLSHAAARKLSFEANTETLLGVVKGILGE